MSTSSTRTASIRRHLSRRPSAQSTTRCEPVSPERTCGALDNLDFTADELAEIDRYTTGSGIDLRRESFDV
jgi:hypothetical protein